MHTEVAAPTHGLQPTTAKNDVLSVGLAKRRSLHIQRAALLKINYMPLHMFSISSHAALTIRGPSSLRKERKGMRLVGARWYSVLPAAQSVLTVDAKKIPCFVEAAVAANHGVGYIVQRCCHSPATSPPPCSKVRCCTLWSGVT